MNKWTGIGRLTAKPELRYNSNNIAYTRFTLAVNRNFKNENGQVEADFINCVAWRKTAELISKSFMKGSQFGVEGRIQTGSYVAQDGSKRYTTDVVVENITFLDKKIESQQTNLHNDKTELVDNDPFQDFGDSIDDNYLD